MRILIVGSGGREHALAWKLSKSKKVTDIFVAPGNGGTSSIATNVPASSMQEILSWIQANPVDLVVIGPDQHLADGIVDKLNFLNIPVFGPTKAAAQIEWSKSFAKQFMKDKNIPTASYEIFTGIEPAKNYVATQKFPLVIKASGLAAGKGVVIAENLNAALTALDEIMQNKVFGEAGSEVVIEEFLVGREISIHAFCDGTTARLFPAAQDHKRAYDGDQGPNTGGMGTIAPIPWVTDEQMKEIEEQVVLPTLTALSKTGSPFKGILFPGIMLTAQGPRVIEFNARFGDPETQSYMRILESDLLEILMSCINSTLHDQEIKWSSQSACCIVCASSGYPGDYSIEKEITGLDSLPADTVVFHAGTKIKEGVTITSGGRVLGVTSTGSDTGTALARGYASTHMLSFDGMYYRTDIGKKSLE